MKANCRHSLVTQWASELIESYSFGTAKQSIFSLLNVPLELIQCQLEDGYLLTREIHDTLVSDLTGETNFSMATAVHRILVKNKSLWTEHDMCVSANKGKYPVTHTSMLAYMSLWDWQLLSKCLTSVLEIALSKDVPTNVPIGVHLYLQYTLRAIARDVEMLPRLDERLQNEMERKLSWSKCIHPLSLAAELLAVTVDVDSRGESLWKEELHGIVPLRDVLLSLFSALSEVDHIPSGELPLLLVRSVVDQLGTFHAQQLFFRSLPSNSLKEFVIDIMLDAKFHLPHSGNEAASELPSLSKTLNIHFAKLPDPSAGGLWSDCGYFLMLLSYLLQCNVTTIGGVDGCGSTQPGTVGGVGGHGNTQAEIRIALQKLTERLSEDARLFSQLTKPVPWFYLQFLTSLTF